MGSGHLCYIRNLSEDEPVDFTLAESLFERAWGTRLFRVAADHKLRRLSSEPFYFLKVHDLISRDAEQAIWSECAMNRGEKVFGYDPTPPMPPFGPWIRKHQMKQCDRTRWQHLPNSIGSFHPQDARVCEPVLRNFPASIPHSPDETFNSKKVPRRIGRGALHEKGSVSASKIDLDRRAPTIDGHQVERRKISRRNNFRVRN